MTRSKTETLWSLRGVYLILCFLIYLPSTMVLAGTSMLITGFDADEVEIRKGAQYDYVNTAVLGPLPIEVLEQDAKHFLKIKTEKLGVLWVNQGDVKTNNSKKYPKNCRSIAIAKKSDVRQYGVRGAGEKCK